MTLQSKYNINDKVWIFREDQHKYYEGTVVNIPQWNEWSGFIYTIEHRDTIDSFVNDKEEKYIFPSKQYIIDNFFIVEEDIVNNE